MRETSNYDPDLDKPVWGAANIAAIINRSERQTYYLLQRGLIDANKVGVTWRSSLRRLLFDGEER